MTASGIGHVEYVQQCLYRAFLSGSAMEREKHEIVSTGMRLDDRGGIDGLASMPCRLKVGGGNDAITNPPAFLLRAEQSDSGIHHSHGMPDLA